VLFPYRISCDFRCKVLNAHATNLDQVCASEGRRAPLELSLILTGTSTSLAEVSAADSKAAGKRRPAGIGVAGARGLCDPERWVDDHGDYLFNFALARLRDPARAEDAVQETFLAALKGGQGFAGGRRRKAGWWAS